MKQKNKKVHCVNNVQIQSFFWSVFSCIRTEYGDLLRDGFLGILVCAESLLAGKGVTRRDERVIRADGDGVIQAGEGVIKAGKNFWCSLDPLTNFDPHMYKMVPRGLKYYILGNQLYSKNAKMLRFHEILFLCQKTYGIIILPEVDWIQKKFWIFS